MWQKEFFQKNLSSQGLSKSFDHQIVSIIIVVSIKNNLSKG